MSRPTRPCNQPHGTVTRYVSGCSCLECANANRDYQRDRKSDPAGPRRVDAGAVRAHIAWLKRSRLMSRRAIAEAAGVDYNTIRLIEQGQRQVHRDTAAALLEVKGRSCRTRRRGWAPRVS